MTPREVVLCLGRVGTGKTRKLHQEVLRRLTELHAAGIATLVLIHDERLKTSTGWDSSAIGYMAPERARFKSVDDMLQAVSDVDGELRYTSYVNAFHEEDPLALFRLADARRQAGRATLVVIDELDTLPERLQRSRPDHAAAYRCLHYGRVGPVDIFATTRQPQRVDPGWFALASRVHVFALTGDLQLDRIRRSGWPDADFITATVPTLPPFHHLTVFPTGEEES